MTTNRIFPSVAPELKKRIVSSNYFFIQFQCNLSIGLRPVESSRNNMIAGAGRAAIVLAPPNMFWEMRWCPRPRPLRLPQPQRTAFTSSACSSSDTPISRPTNDGNKVSASTTAPADDCHQGLPTHARVVMKVGPVRMCDSQRNKYVLCLLANKIESGSADTVVT